MKFLGKYREGGLLFMRIGLGVMFILHGWPKLIGGPSAWTKIGGAISSVGISFSGPLSSFTTVFGFMAAIAETLGGVCLIIGILFRPACLLLMLTMIVATMMHWRNGDSFMQKTSRPLELAFVFAGLMFIGPGKYSIDKS